MGFVSGGVDPVSRDDLLDVFMELCENGITILFSTHITSDLDKCADKIVYIKNGFTALIKKDDTLGINVDYVNADLESIMIHIEKEEA